MGEGYRNRGAGGKMTRFWREGQIMPATLLLTTPSPRFSDLPTVLLGYLRDTSKLEVLKQDKLFFKIARSDQGSFYCK